MRIARALCVAALLSCLIAKPAAAKTPTPEPRLTFGAYVDPWNMGPWRAAGLDPGYVARFEAFSRGTTVHSFLRESESQGLKTVMVTWEPWKPVSAELGVVAQFAPQPGYTNAEIASGVQDEYMLRFARNLATFKGRVYLRYAHEMNGTWYPWSRDPVQYRRAWRHMVRLFASVGATNVSFVWSPYPSLYLSERTWMKSVRVYWPGARYVDAVGSTMIDFGGSKDYAAARFEPRLRALRKLYKKPIMLTEVKAEKRGRMRWLRELRRMLRRARWIRSIAWFQQQSRGQAQLPGVGTRAWDLTADPAAAKVMRGIIRDGRR